MAGSSTAPTPAVDDVEVYVDGDQLHEGTYDVEVHAAGSQEVIVIFADVSVSDGMSNTFWIGGADAEPGGAGFVRMPAGRSATGSWIETGKSVARSEASQSRNRSRIASQIVESSRTAAQCSM